MRHVTLLALAVFILAQPIHAQNVTGAISGIVHDPSGAVVPGVKVTATNAGTSAKFQTSSDGTGAYTIRTLPVGVYDLTAEQSGFKKFETKGIRLQVNEVARMDVTLSVGSVGETVTVSGQALAVDTTTATLKAVVDQKRIEELPLNGRNPTQLMQLIVGVVKDTRADVTSGTTYPGTNPVSVNGNRSNSTNYVLDGAQNNDHYSNAANPMPNPDALQEFSVQTNNFSAEFGRQSGGLVNAVTKSGTNEIHGSAFEFVRNKAMNARNFFNPPISPGSNVRRDDGLKRNQFGFTVGGPVVIPKVYNGRDKSFFFFSYQGTRQRQTPSSASIVVPTAAQRAGDFSSITNRTLRNPFSNLAPFPGNQIPVSLYSPISNTIAKDYIPLPTSGNTITVAAPNAYRDDQTLIRGDQQLGSNNRLSGRFWRSLASQPGLLTPNNYFEQTTPRHWNNTSVTITDTHIVSPTVTNQFLFGYNHTNGDAVPVYPPKGIKDLGSNYYNDNKPQFHLTVAGYWGTMNTGDTNDFIRKEYQFTDTIRWSKGKHQITIGGEFNRGIGDIINNFRANGQWNFNGTAPFTTDSLADFFLGKFNTLGQGVGEYKKTRFDMYSVFFQDSIKVRRNFSVDLGVRWEPFLPFTDVDGKLATWRRGQQSTRYANAPLGVVYPGDAGIPDGGFERTMTNLGPRIGFAWDVFGDGRTAVRGGYGIFFDRSNTISTNSQANQAPFGTVVTVNGNNVNSFANPWAGTTNPFPGTTTPPSTVAFPQFSTQFLYEQSMRNPYVQSWNLTLEREIAGGFIGRLSYAGSKGTRLVALREFNAAVYAPGVTTATTNARRPLAPGLGNVTIIEPVSNSTYHALQFTAERRFAKGFSILANYQFAKSIDDASANKATGQARTDPNNQAFDKGPSDFDKRHVMNLSGLWELPFRSQNRFANAVIGGWNLNTIVSLWSGFPFTVTSGVDNARTGTGGQRADLIGQPNLGDNRSQGERIDQYLNKAAFAPNTIGTFGTLGRNTFRAPGFASVDFGLSKGFTFRERLTTTFRFESFNAFNRTNLNAPVSAQNNVQFMRITSAQGDPRILQLALRLTF
ncbi:MAG: TonB-dependent receptor [Acidobacteriia bacterium]|nr:TonB-dependent receptor [Terriglobia bacterium]